MQDPSIRRPGARRRRWPGAAALVSAGLGAALLVGLGTGPAAAACEDLAGLRLQDTTITVARTIPADSFTPPGAAAPLVGLGAFCRLAGIIAPTADSRIGFEVWLPPQWNGRYLQVGNGGFAGSIPHNALALGVVRGYATAGTDDGHEGSGLEAGWALGHPEKIVDFGHRAVHLTALRAKEVIAAYYQAPPRRAYFDGCSGGGREALMEAQRYPDDFDGWVVGAPAYNWTRLMAAFAWNTQALSASPGSALTPAALQTLSAAALDRCDARDGVVDGIVGDPQRCPLRPRELVCGAGQTADCLTPAQAEAAEAIRTGAATPQGGRIYPGWPPGHEVEEWLAWMTGEAALQTIFANGFFGNMVYGQPGLDVRAMDLAEAVAAADAWAGPIVDATDPDLSRIRAGGKKIIHYHGWADAAISAQASIDYYQAVAARLGRGNQDFYRLFLAPGMNHCDGGPGPNSFGYTTGPFTDPEHDALAALLRWVEEGRPPASLIATKFVNDDPAQGVQRSRPLCPWPQVATYTGRGDTNQAASFTCARP